MVKWCLNFYFCCSTKPFCWLPNRKGFQLHSSPLGADWHLNAKQAVGYTILGLLWLWLMVLTFRFLSLNYQGPFIVLKQILILKNALSGATMQQCQSVTRLLLPASVTAMILLSIANTFKGARNKWFRLNSLCLQSRLPHSVIFIINDNLSLGMAAAP